MSEASTETCYTFARGCVKGLTGVDLPADHAEALRLIARGDNPIGRVVPAGEACRAGDLLSMRLPGQRRQHVGVALDAFNGEHWHDGKIVGFSIAPLRAAGVIVMVVRVGEKREAQRG